MKLILICFSTLFFKIALSQEPLDCSNFKKGTFKVSGKKTIYIRDNVDNVELSFQQNSMKLYMGEIKWLNPCNYSLILKDIYPKGESDTVFIKQFANMKNRTTIIPVSDSCYKQVLYINDVLVSDKKACIY